MTDYFYGLVVLCFFDVIKKLIIINICVNFLCTKYNYFIQLPISLYLMTNNIQIHKCLNCTV